MLSSGDYATQLQQIQNDLNPYSDPALLAKTKAVAADAYKPVIQNSLDATRNDMATFLPRFMAIPYSGLTAGTDAASLTPQQKLMQMSGQLGLMGGQLTADQGVTTTLGGSLNDMATTALNSLQFGKQGLQEKYSNTQGMFNSAQAAEEAQKQRDMQARLASLSRASAPIYLPPPPQKTAANYPRTNSNGQPLQALTPDQQAQSKVYLANQLNAAVDANDLASLGAALTDWSNYMTTPPPKYYVDKFNFMRTGG